MKIEVNSALGRYFEVIMEYLKVNGGRKLNGKVSLTAAKNSVLPIVACSLMVKGEILLRNCSPLSDIRAMLKIINSLGGNGYFEKNEIIINTDDAEFRSISANLTGGIRSSVFILGPLLSRFKKAVVSYPGGCEIGLRPIDLHIYALRQLGVKIVEEGGRIYCDGSQMKQGEVYLDFPSVGATENAIMAAVLLSGKSVIRNAAREPEICDLANFINSMGGKIYGAGSDTIEIEGVKELRGCEYTPLCDRITAGTIFTACASCGGDVMIEKVLPLTLSSVLDKFSRTGSVVTVYDDGIRIKSSGKIKAIHKIETQPFPGFPTDMQAQFVSMLTRARGCSLMVENLFESRFKYTNELNKMGAKITVKDRVAVIKGVAFLRGADIKAEDLRGGAALVNAALGAEGESRIYGVEHIDRGYYSIEETFSALGGEIKRKIIEN